MWKAANRGLVWLGPAIPAVYAGAITLASEASDNQAAKDFRDWQIDMIAYLLGSPAAMAWVALVVLLWAFALWFTHYMDVREEREIQSLSALGKRAQTCADGIVRLMALYDNREAVANQHAWRHKEDRDYFIASASAMSDYNVLYGQEALAICKSAERKGFPLEDRAVEIAESPTNSLGVKRVARDLTVLADRLRTNDKK